MLDVIVARVSLGLVVLDNLSGYNPVHNSGGLYKRGIRNDRDQFYVNHVKVLGDKTDPSDLEENCDNI